MTTRRIYTLPVGTMLKSRGYPFHILAPVQIECSEKMYELAFGPEGELDSGPDGADNPERDGRKLPRSQSLETGESSMTEKCITTIRAGTNISVDGLILRPEKDVQIESPCVSSDPLRSVRLQSYVIPAGHVIKVDGQLLCPVKDVEVECIDANPHRFVCSQSEGADFLAHPNEAQDPETGITSNLSPESK